MPPELFVSVGSSWSRRAITWRASSTGTLLNRLTTSKLTMWSPASRGWGLICSTKYVEFCTWEIVFPDSGARMLARVLARRWVGDPMAATNGRREFPLCALLASHRSVEVLSGWVSEPVVVCLWWNPSLLASSRHWNPWFQFWWWGPFLASLGHTPQTWTVTSPLILSGSPSWPTLTHSPSIITIPPFVSKYINSHTSTMFFVYNWWRPTYVQIEMSCNF